MASLKQPDRLDRAQTSRERGNPFLRPKIGILFPGQMGSALGALLQARGFEVLTTVAGRSERSADLSRWAGLSLLDSVRAVVADADILISLVPPAAAVDIAQLVAANLPGRSSRLTYLDCNSISPATMRVIAAVFSQSDVDVVDGAIHGLASRLATHGTLFLSGAVADDLALAIGVPPQSAVLGVEVGRASLLKLLLSGLSKGLVSMLLEMSYGAIEGDVIGEYWRQCHASYPGVMEVFDRLVPGYWSEAPRRKQEIAELEASLEALGIDPIMTTALRRNLEETIRAPDMARAVANRLAQATVETTDAG